MPEYRFIWFGHTPLISVPQKVRKAVHTKLNNLIFPGYVTSGELLEAYSGADLFVFPTYEETEGITLLEAIASKQKVLVRDLPIFSDWLEDGRHVYKAKTVDEFEHKIRAILKGEAPLLVENAYEAVKERTLDIIGGQLKSIYQHLIPEEPEGV
jgi:1,2-diacylglycerol-3-alpha-glucose alpha-1,2-glucosyltransferase